jgi:hypothetical protein
MMLFRASMLVVITALFATRSRAGTVPDPVVAFHEGFENPPFFYELFQDCDGGCDSGFDLSSSPSHTGTYAVHTEDPHTAGERWLQLTTRILIPANAENAELTFWHRFDFERNGEFTYDGGVLEVSTEGPTHNSNWSDVGPLMTAGGYTGSILASATMNPLAGRAAWVGANGDWQQVRVDLSSYRGQYIDFRFGLGADVSTNGTFDGWRVDDIELSYRAPLASCSRGWSAVSSYPFVAFDMALVGVGEALYSFGGIENHSATAAAYRYSPDDDQWTPIAPLPEPRRGAAAVTDGTYIYVLGGSDSDTAGTGSLWRYDPATNRYLALKPFAIGTASHAAVYLNGVIYRIAGKENYNSAPAIASVEAYTVASNTWRAVADYPDTQARFAAMTFGGYIYTAGGGDTTSVKAYRYDPARNMWDVGPIADLPGIGGYAFGALFNGTWIVFDDNSWGLGWDPITNYWRSIDFIPGGVLGVQVAATDNAAYALFDSLSSSDTTAVWQYGETNCAAACLGDCGGDGAVAVSDLVRGVAIALNQQPLVACPSFDGNHDGHVAVNELVTAVGNALSGCGRS